MTIHAGAAIECIGRFPIIQMTGMSACMEWSSGDLPIHIYGYNNEHAVIVALLLSVPHHRFQKSPFLRVENGRVV